MAENFQDNISYGGSTLAVSGDAVAIGSTNAGAKSVIFNNTGSQGHLAWQPTANRTINLPDSGGTLQLTGQAPGALAAGTQTATSGTIVFSNSNGLTFGMSNSSVVTASYTVPSTAGLISNINVSAGTTSNNLSALTFSNSNGLSFGLNGSTITGSYTVPNVPAQTNQTVGLYALGNTTQNSSTTLDARTLSFNGLGAATVGYSNGSIQVSVPVQSAQTQNVIQAISGGTSSQSSGTIVFGNSNGITFGLSNGTITATVNPGAAAGLAAAQAGTQTATSGTLVFSNSNGISFGMSNSSVVTASYTVPSTAGLISNINVSAGTTSNNLSAVTFSNSNGLAFGLNGSVVTGSYTVPTQTAQTIGLYALGNTTQNSSTTLDARTLSFNGLGIITAGYSNGSIQLSATQSAQTQNVVVPSAGTQTATSGTVVFSNSNGISFGMSNSSVVTASYTVPTQTNQSVGLYALGNTTQNSSTTLDARSLSFNGLGIITAGYSNGSIQISATQSAYQFSNSNNVSFGTNGSTVTATATFAQTNQTVGLYALGNTTQNSSTTLDARTLSFNGLGAATVGYSNGSIQISVPTQTAQTQSNIQAIYDGANSISTGTIRFSNSNGVSFGVNGQTLTASVAAQTNQSIGVYAVSNTTQSSSGTLDARSLSFQGAGIASVGYTNGSVVISVPSGGAGSVNISAGTTSNNLTNFVFSNSNNVSFGLNGSTVTATVTTPAQTAQTVGLYALGNTTQNSSTTLDARTLSFNGLGAATVGYSNGSIQISVPVQSAQTQSNIQAIYDGANSISTGTIQFANANGVSFSINGQTISGSVAAQTNQTIGIYATSNTTGASSSSTYDARSITFQGAGIASVGHSNGSVIISVPSGGGAGDGVNILAAGTQTANTTGTVLFSNSNGISFGMSNSSIITASYTVPTQTAQTIGLYALGNTTQNSSTTLDARTLSFNGLGIITAGYSNGSIQLSATQSAQTQNVVVPSAGTQTATSGTAIFSNSNGVSFGMSNSSVITASFNGTLNSVVFSNANNITFGSAGNTTITASYLGVNYSAGTTSNNLGSIVFSNSNGVSFGLNGSTITASASLQTEGLYALGNTVGQSSSTTIDPRSQSISGIGNISVGYSAGAIIISGSGGGGGVALSAGTNSTSTGTVVFSNSNGISFGMNTDGVVTASVPAIAGSDVVFSNSNNIIFGNNVSTITASAVPYNISQLDPFGYLPVVSNSGLGQNSLYFVPFDVPEYLSANRINVFVSVATTFVTTANSSGTGGYTQSAAIYVRDSGTNSTRITSQWSGSWFMSYSASSGTQIKITYPNGISNSTAVSTNSTGLTTSNASTFPLNSIGGYRAIAMPISSIMTPGRYWLAIANSSTSNNAVAILNCSVMQVTYSNNIAFRPFGTSSAASNASFYGIRDGLGTYSVTSNAFPGTVIMNSDSIRAAVTGIIPYFNFSGYTTATNMI